MSGAVQCGCWENTALSWIDLDAFIEFLATAKATGAAS